MADIRSTVGFLGEDHESLTVPTPGLDDLPGLLADFRGAGLAVAYDVHGDLAQVPATTALGLYRIVQESLANVAKHAPRSQVQVRLDVSRGPRRADRDQRAPTGRTPQRRRLRPHRDGRAGGRARCQLPGRAGRPVLGGPGGAARGDLNTEGHVCPLPKLTAPFRRTAPGTAFSLTESPLIRVLLVDDQELVRSGLTRILRRRDGFLVVGECEDGDQVASAVEEHRPDVVVMDLRMRRMSGIEATLADRRRADTPPVLVLTTFDDDELLSGALRAGAAGFLLKDSPAEDVVRGVAAVAAGHALLDPAVTGRVLDRFRATPDAVPATPPEAIERSPLASARCSS